MLDRIAYRVAPIALISTHDGAHTPRNSREYPCLRFVKPVFTSKITTTMGKIVATVKLTNATDKLAFEEGTKPEDAIRTYTMDMLADTGSVLLALPQDVVEHLGLKERTRMTFVLADDRRQTMPIAGPVFVEILGREMIADCVVLAPGSPPLLGLIVLERLDLIPDPLNQRLTVRPESPLVPMRDLRSSDPHVMPRAHPVPGTATVSS